MSLTRSFADQSTPGPSGPITAWSWNFGDGGTSTGQNPTHTYAAPGTYTVGLTVTGSGSDGTATISHSVTVSSTALAAAFGTSSTSGAAPLTVSFTDLSTAGPSGPITGWSWNFGDTGTSTAQNPTHTFAAAGTYTVTLTVTGTSPDGTASASRTITVTGSPGPPAPPGGTLGIMLLNYNHLASFGTDPNQYAYVAGGAWSSDTTVTSTVAGRGLSYFNFSVVQTSFSTGVPYSQASANNWLLKDANGKFIVNSFGAYLADVGNAAYQQAWIANVLSYLASRSGIDGVFIDAVNYDPKGLGNGNYPVKYPNTASWSAAEVSCLKAVYASLNAKGKYVMANASAWKSGDSTFSDGTSTINWWTSCAPYCDALCNEFYAETNNGTNQLRANGTAWYQNWTGWQRLIGTAQNAGCDFIGLTYGAASSTASMQYGKASFLLEWNGSGGAFGYAIKAASSTNPTNIAWTRSIGTPSGAKSAVGVGWIRHYTGGVVCVNPSPSTSQTFSLGGTYTDDSGASQTSITLAPTTAEILHT